MGKAPYRLVILKRRFPHFIRKTIVRTTHISALLTIVDFHAFEGDSGSRFESVYGGPDDGHDSNHRENADYGLENGLHGS